ncbi:hypothetical protein [Azospirillum sp. TSH64]|uniref:hypothetical protein n=1 Tax=Azospirillum sp. TSH64 TaxID=652740 RepID=UPI001FFE9912|nr:hypothetical protein [Azospirillum sp. TSH64]
MDGVHNRPDILRGGRRIISIYRLIFRILNDSLPDRRLINANRTGRDMPSELVGRIIGTKEEVKLNLTDAPNNDRIYEDVLASS